MYSRGRRRARRRALAVELPLAAVPARGQPMFDVWMTIVAHEVTRDYRPPPHAFSHPRSSGSGRFDDEALHARRRQVKDNVEGVALPTSPSRSRGEKIRNWTQPSAPIRHLHRPARLRAPVDRLDRRHRLQPDVRAGALVKCLAVARLDERVERAGAGAVLLEVLELEGRPALVRAVVGPDLEPRPAGGAGNVALFRRTLLQLHIVGAGEAAVAEHAGGAEEPVAHHLEALVGARADARRADRRAEGT